MSLSLLEEAVGFIGRHAEFTGKDRLSRTCREEIEGRHRLGSITGEERDRLLNLLSGELLQVANCG